MVVRLALYNILSLEFDDRGFAQVQEIRDMFLMKIFAVMGCASAIHNAVSVCI